MIIWISPVSNVAYGKKQKQMEYISKETVRNVSLPNLKLQNVVSTLQMPAEEKAKRLKDAEVKFFKSNLSSLKSHPEIMKELENGRPVLKFHGQGAKIYLLTEDEEHKTCGYKMTIGILSDIDIENLWSQLDVKEEDVFLWRPRRPN